MKRRPPISKRTDTLFPYTTRFRSKGIHTTTVAEMFELPPPDHQRLSNEHSLGSSGAGGRVPEPADPAGQHPEPSGYLIDTPGIKEFGIIDIAKEELSHFFVEMRERFNQCKFDNCRHINEPGCAVIKAVEAGEIDVSRYESYLSMYDGFDNRA